MSDGTSRRIDDAIEAALREWPRRERSEPEWEALARRIEERLDEAAALPHFDPTTTPVFEDEVAGDAPAESARARENGRGRGPLVVVALAAALALGVGVTAMLSVTGSDAGEVALAPPSAEPSGAAPARSEEAPAEPLAEPTPATPPAARNLEVQGARPAPVERPAGGSSPGPSGLEPLPPVEGAEGREYDLGSDESARPRPAAGTLAALAERAGPCADAGTVTVRLAVAGRTGTVTRVEATGADPEVRACVERALATLRFPPRGSDSTASFRIRLGPAATALPAESSTESVP